MNRVKIPLLVPMSCVVCQREFIPQELFLGDFHEVDEKGNRTLTLGFMVFCSYPCLILYPAQGTC